jgi:hypothetical protein
MWCCKLCWSDDTCGMRLLKSRFVWRMLDKIEGIAKG